MEPVPDWNDYRLDYESEDVEQNAVSQPERNFVNARVDSVTVCVELVNYHYDYEYGKQMGKFELHFALCT